MKHIKNIVLLLFLSVLTCMTQACSHDEDIDDLQSSMDNYNADMAIIVNPITLSGATLIDTDLNGYTYIANPQILSDNKINQKGQRIFYTYTAIPQSIGADSIPYITIMQVNKVLTKEPVFVEDNDAKDYGTDPIEISGQSISKAHLNLRYTFLNGGNHLIPHSISLLIAKDAQPDARGYLSAELRHDAADDLQLNANSGYVSFTLENMPGFKEGTLKGFKIKTKTIKNETDIVEVTMNNNRKSMNFNI